MEHLYYLMAQLPAFSSSDDANYKFPITTDYFKDLCGRFMSAKSAETARNLSLEPPLEVKPTGSVFLDAWYDKERNLRLALAQLRALKMKKETKNLPLPNDGDVVQAARTAVGMENPLGAEQFLNQYRLGVLDRMTPLDMFSADSVYNYGLRLMLAERMKKFDKDEGLASYHKIYDEILGEDK